MVKKDLNRVESSEGFKAQVLSEIKLGKLPAAIKAISEILNSIQDKELRKMLLIICYDYHKLRVEVTKGLLHKEEEAIQQSKIINRIIELFDSYEEIQYHEKEVLSEANFWEIIAFLDWEKTGDDEAVIAPAVDELSKLPVAFIYQFEDKLAEKLYQLDTQIHAENCGVNRWKSGKYFSADVFLYERCCVVANGKDFYEKVLADATQMPKDIDFEPLLYIAANSYEKQTNTPMQYAPTVSYETFSNKSAWNIK